MGGAASARRGEATRGHFPENEPSAPFCPFLPHFRDLIKVLKWYVDRITEVERQEHIQEVLKVPGGQQGGGPAGGSPWWGRRGWAAVLGRDPTGLEAFSLHGCSC